MRLSDLLKAEAVNEAGQRLGHVHDVRFRSATETPIAWTAEALIVGKSAIAERLGYSRGVVTGPWLLVQLFMWMSRHARVIPWGNVVAVERGKIVVRGSLHDFGHVGHVRRAAGGRGD